MYLRRDVRGNRFINQTLPDDILDRILRAGMMAPSVGFSQPWRFVRIRNTTIRERVADIFKEENSKAESLFADQKQAQYQQLKLEGIRESAVNIAVFYEHSQNPVLGQTSMEEAGLYSVVCAIQNMWLMARALNVGMGWVSILDAASMEELLGAKENQRFVAYLCIGYVDTFYDRPELETLGWAERMSRDEVLFDDSLSSTTSTDESALP